MFRQKSQTATEYLVITAIVIIIALIVVSILGNIPGFGSGSSEQASRAILSSQKIAIIEYGVSDYDTVLTIQNTHNAFIEIDSISIGGENCNFFVGQNPKLGIGKSQTVTCNDVFELDDSRINALIVINWTDTKTGASYSQSGPDLVLIGRVGSKYLATLTSNPYWNSTSGEGCWDSSVEPKPICTCLDLNRTRDQPGWNYSLQNNIDFIRCQETFGDAGWRSGTGWAPIGTCTSSDCYADGENSYTGTFEGNGFVISNLYINRPAEFGVGLFGNIYDGDAATIQNLGLVNVKVTGNEIVGGLVGYGYNYPALTNNYVAGNVSGTSSVGGLIGRAGTGTTIRGSFSTGTVTGSGLIGGLIGVGSSLNIFNSYSHSRVAGSANSIGGLIGGGSFNENGEIFATGYVSGNSNVGGLIGYLGSSGTIKNLYATGTVNGTGTSIGGLVGYWAGVSETLEASSSTNFVYGGSNVGGVVGSSDNSVTTLNVYWTNYTGDDANGCSGDGQTSCSSR